MLTAADRIRALEAALPPDQHAEAHRLATILTDAANGMLTVEAAQVQMAALPDTATLIGALAGQRIQAAQSVLTFGADSQFGHVCISDVAGRNE